MCCRSFFSRNWLQFQLGAGEPPPTSRRLSDKEASLLAAFRKLPVDKRKLLVDFLS